MNVGTCGVIGGNVITKEEMRREVLENCPMRKDKEKEGKLTGEDGALNRKTEL